MDKTVLITLNELLAWRELDVWRRKHGFREMFPHQGFHGIRPIIGCECCTCATKWHMTDIERVEKHNMKVEGPIKEEFTNAWVLKNGSKAGLEWNWANHYGPIKEEQIQNSLSRTLVLKDVLLILEKDRTQWTDFFANLLKTKKEEKEKKLIRELIRLLFRLLNDEVSRNKIIKGIKPSGSEDWGLRTLVPTVLHAKKEWNSRFYMSS
jgi:hypothetical protein